MSATYNFDVDVVVCIDANGTMTAYWKDEDTGNYKLVHTVANWDGSSTTSGSFRTLDTSNYNENDICQGAVALTITQTGTDADGSVLVDVDWDLLCDQPSPKATGSGTIPLKISIGQSCPV